MLYIDQLKASAVRNLVDLDIKPAKGLNLFYGPNASGKTSVLETIFLLSRVKSFRSKRIADVIQKGDKVLQVYAEGSNGESRFSAGIEKGHGITRLKFDGEMVLTASTQAKKLPVYILTPEYQSLFTGTPKDRRHWLDWSMFHVEHGYLQTWKSYNRALRHRNALLKSERYLNSSEMLGWERLMQEEGQKIDQMRQAYIKEINDLLNSEYLPTVLSANANICYQRTEYIAAGLDHMLANSREEDAKRGYTLYGPHRTDISFACDEHDVAKHLSRGQTKLFAAALISAQIANLRNRGINALILVDDLDAELDDDATRKMLDLLLANGSQAFVSSLNRKDWFGETNNALFHVKHGKVKKMIE
ncbi:MAG: DNA replication and repair protein RecF [Proteobacteria bacterium]|nr:DNA replication and repair protein RecF [Pseudomonadota bacterium]